MLPSTFLRTYWPLLLFGWLLSFASGFGQTYFISIFGGAIRTDFGLDHGSYGLSYSVGTLASGCMLLWFGRLIDRVSLRTYSLAAVLGLAIATLAMSVASGVVALTCVFFLLRFFGQGLMSHAAITTMARYFTAERGRAVAFSVTGHVAGGVLFPLTSAALLSVLQWRQIWWLSSFALALMVVPLVLFLLSPERYSRNGDGYLGSQTTGTATISTTGTSISPRQWTLREALHDPRMHAHLAVLLAPSFVTTGLIFHQVHIGVQKGWGLDVVASALSTYALASFVTMLVAGRLIDRYSARRLVPMVLAPMIAACLLLTHVTSVSGAIAFFILLGLGSGLTKVLMGAIWAESYGTLHLGAIRSLVASGSVFASALAPGLFGLLLDRQWTVGDISLLCAGYGAMASIAAALTERR